MEVLSFPAGFARNVSDDYKARHISHPGRECCELEFLLYTAPAASDPAMAAASRSLSASSAPRAVLVDSRISALG